MLEPLQIWGYTIEWFDITATLAFISSVVYYNIHFRLEHKNFKLSSVLSVNAVLLLILFIGIMGARLLAATEHFATSHVTISHFSLYSVFISGTHGASWLGSVMIFLPILLVTRKSVGRIGNFDSLFFKLLIAITISHAIGRIGCMLSADGCYGIYTNSIFGIRLPHGTEPTFLPVHPTPFYESFYSILIILILFYIKRISEYSWIEYLGFYLIIYSVGRFCIEFLRINDPFYLNFTFYQCICIFNFLIGILLLIKPTSPKNHINLATR